MLAHARNDDTGSSDHAPLDDAMRPLGERLRRALEQGGVRQLVRRGVNRVASPWLELGSVTFFRRPLDRGPEVPRPRPGLVIFHAALHDLRLVLEASDPRRTPELVRARFGRGDLCFLALDPAGSPIHSGWATTVGAHVPELDRHIVLRPYEAYLYDAFTPPSRRGTGAFGFVLDHLFAELQARGARVVYSYVRSDDPKGQRAACARLQPVGTVRHIRLRRRVPLMFGGSARGLPALVR